MMKKTPVFDYRQCINCGMCVQACPVSVLAMTRTGRQGKYRNVFPEIVRDACLGCGSCERACVMKCITMETHES